MDHLKKNIANTIFEPYTEEVYTSLFDCLWDIAANNNYAHAKKEVHYRSLKDAKKELIKNRVKAEDAQKYCLLAFNTCAEKLNAHQQSIDEAYKKSGHTPLKSQRIKLSPRFYLGVNPKHTSPALLQSPCFIDEIKQNFLKSLEI